MTHISTERLILREMTLNDLQSTGEIVCDEQTMYAWNGAWSEEENLENLRKQIRGYSEDGFGRWAVVLKETGKVIGICGLQYCDTDTDRVLEIGYLFNREYWRNGYAAEAAIACKRYAFDVLAVHEVFSLIRDTNIASMNVAIRNGMVVRRRFMKTYKGEVMPHYVFSVKRSGSVGDNIDKRGILDNEVFDYRITKAGKVFINYNGKHVTTLSDSKAAAFIAAVKNASGTDAQLLMAKATGNFKRGNEKMSKRG